MSKNKINKLGDSQLICREDLEDEILDDLEDFKEKEKLDTTSDDEMETEEEDGMAEYFYSILIKAATLVNAKALTDASVRKRLKYLLKTF